MAAVPFPLRQQAGYAADDVVKYYFQVLFDLHRQATAPLEEHVGRIGHADNDGADQTTAETEPEGGQDDGQVI